MTTGYVSYLHESPNPVPSGPITPGMALLGGPPEGPPPEVDAAFAWLFAKSGWGRFVVIGADGSDEYGRYIYQALPPPHPACVETLIFSSREAASDDAVIATIRSADALFIQGGDQWDYVRLWQDTPVQQAIHELLRRGVPIGGSSAGLAVLGEFLFSARNDTVYSSEALSDPYHACMTLERAFIDSPNLEAPYAYLRNTITDSHFHDRERMGRMLAFLARLAQDGWSQSPRGIAVDEMTAVLVEADGVATVVDKRPEADRGSACFLLGPGAPHICQPGQPLTYENVSAYRIRASDRDATFDLRMWEGRGGENYLVSAQHGVVCYPGSRST